MTSRAERWIALLAGLALVAAGACARGGEGDAGGADAPAAERPGGPGARWDVVEMLREGAGRERHPADGGGRAWLERADDEPPARVGTPARFTIVYEVGPLGIARGGGVYLQVSPFWGWSTPQVEIPGGPGFTEIESEGVEDGIELEPETLSEQLMVLHVTGRPLVEGDRIRMIYGAGPLGALTDRYAERNSRFWIAVDGDGDDVRTTLPDSPGIDVLPGPPAQLHVVLPSVARPGEDVRGVVAVLDAAGDTNVSVTGEVRFEHAGPGLGLPEGIELLEGDGGRGSFRVLARTPGVYRVRARGPHELEAESNPMVVSPEGPRVRWGDLHGHSALSDGTGIPEDYFVYARDVAALDVAVLTDHDHWGLLPLDGHPDQWQRIAEQTRRFHDPGHFVTVLGYEWTSWIHGHRHVLYFDGEGEIYSSIDPDYESPPQLWRALEGQRALTVAHHSAGGPIPLNWEIPPDPRFEPVTEIVSVHGSSEASDSPGRIYSAYEGNFVRDALDRGYRLGFIGSGDSHDGHPGLPQLAAGPGLGGLAAILTEELTRDGVLAALRERRSYATNGPRIVLRAALGGHGMGAAIPVPETGALDEDLYVHVVATAPLERVDLIRSGAVVDSLALEGRREVELQRTLPDLASGEYVYVRVLQEDGGAAWSSPFFLE